MKFPTLLCAVSAFACQLLASPLEPGWGTEPVEVISETRSTVCLNGLWQFAPDASTEAPAPTSEEWGLKHVPGAWANSHWSMQLRKSIHEFGVGPRWEGATHSKEFKDLNSAWYGRPLHIPADWDGSAILLDFRRVSTDAVVFVNGQKAGEVFWPSGQVDITDYVSTGQVAVLTMQVFATTSEAVTLNFMATADSQVHVEEAKLNHRGIIGEVFMHKQPKGGHVDDVFIMTSVREKKLDLEITLDDSVAAGDFDVTIEAYDQDGVLGFQAATRLSYDPELQDEITLSAPWENPKLWDFGQPNLYTLHLKVSGEGIHDVYTQRFGFREFWIEGRQFYMNGHPVNLRPTLAKDGDAAGNPAFIRKHIRRYMEMGFNVAELWPKDHSQRGLGHYRKLWKEIADEEGLGLIGTLNRSNTYIVDTKWRFSWDERKEEYRRDMIPELVEFRNHPSVLYWVNSGNFFGHHQDQNPRSLGRETEVNENWHRRERAGEEAIAMIKEADPTRPVATHQGAQVGDVFMTNFYLNVLPLQDRMEWLSDYVENGTMPFMPVEMGSPLDSTFKRGRNGFGKNARSEPIMTEFLAIYQGAGAYMHETQEYRNDIEGLFDSGQSYGYSQNLHSIITAPTFQEMQVLFAKNTYRAWRTWEHSAGMIAWANAHGWVRNEGFHGDRISSEEPFAAGHRGTWLPEIMRFKTAPYMEEGGWTQLPAGDNLVAHSQPTLAWIAGSSEAFTERSHSFEEKTAFEKQLVLINDNITTQPYSVSWSALVGGDQVSGGEFDGSVGITEKVFLPIEIKLPGVSSKTEGVIKMKAKIGDVTHEDSFAFRVFEDPKKLKLQATLIDPKGMTTAMLDAVNVKVTGSSSQLTIFGREALGDGEALSPETLESVRSGGTALVMIQERDWYRDLLGFRIADHISRQIFPVDAGHPVVAGLDVVDLRNWNGEATLIDAYPELDGKEVRKGAYGVPYYGWRWGSRGAVSSAMLEKPHHAGWTPILEGEFDLAYSPLMELAVGSGRVILCSLDLEDMAANDAAAAKLTRQILTYASSEPTRSQVPVYHIGDHDNEAFLRSLGLKYEPIDKMTTGPGLIVISSLEGLTIEMLKAQAEKGSNVLVLPQSEASDALPLSGNVTSLRKNAVPNWPELKGISVSELRTRSIANLKALPELDGLELAAGGLLGRIQTSGGSIVFTQLDPEALEADSQNFLRYTRWRFTRATSQLIANLGGSFQSDLRVFTERSGDANELDLSGEWSYLITHQIADPNADRHDDIGLTSEAKALLEGTRDLPDTYRLAEIPNLIPEFNGVNGEAVFERRVYVPESMLGQDLELSLGRIDDLDMTYVNGRKVGEGDGWNTPREYIVPSDLLQAGENVIRVRVWDNFGGGGFNGSLEEFSLRVPGSESSAGVYHSDFIDDFALGDDPYRYYRW